MQAEKKWKLVSAVLGVLVIILGVIIVTEHSSQTLNTMNDRTPLSGRYIYYASTEEYNRYFEFTEEGDFIFIRPGAISTNGSYYVEGNYVYMDYTMLQVPRRTIGEINGDTITVDTDGVDMDFIKE